MSKLTRGRHQVQVRGGRLWSLRFPANGAKFHIITDADGSVTTGSGTTDTAPDRHLLLFQSKSLPRSAGAGMAADGAGAENALVSS